MSALIAPEIVRFTADSVSGVPYAGAYLAIIGLNVIGAIGMWFLDIPRPARAHGVAGTGRPLRVIALQPAFVVAVPAGWSGSRR